MIPPESILSKTKGQSTSLEESYALLVNALAGAGDVVGRTFEVFDKNGELQYTVRQKPLTPLQIKALGKGTGKVREEEMKVVAAGVAKGIAIAMGKDRI